MSPAIWVPPGRVQPVGPKGGDISGTFVTLSIAKAIDKAGRHALENVT